MYSTEATFEALVQKQGPQTLHYEDRESTERLNNSLWGQKQLTAFLDKTRLKLLGIVDERRQRNTSGCHRLPCCVEEAVCTLLRSSRNSTFVMRAMASSERAVNPLSQMRRGTTVMAESKAAYYSRWDEGIALKHFRWLILQCENFNQAFGVRLMYMVFRPLSDRQYCLLVSRVSEGEQVEGILFIMEPQSGCANEEWAT